MKPIPPEINERAETALREFERLTGLNVTLHDMRGTICDRAGGSLLYFWHSHMNPCCVYGRADCREWDKRCIESCFTQSEKNAAATGKPYVKKCWKGLEELVVPLMDGKQHQLTLYAGAFRPPSRKRSGSFPQDEKYLKLFNALPPRPSAKRIAGLAAMLTLLGQGMLYSLNLDRPVNDPSRGMAIRNFVNANAHRKVTLSDLAKYMHLSVSRTSHVVRELTRMSFEELLLKRRMELAVYLLIHSQASLQEIAMKTGFNSPYYFNRTFKVFHGIPPGKYRLCNGKSPQCRNQIIDPG